MTKARGFYIAEPTDDELRIALLDLDDTLAYGTWHPRQTKSVIGAPIVANVEKAKELYNEGYTLRIWTARPWAEENMIRAWCDAQGLIIDSVICGKPLCTIMIDDKACNALDTVWAPRRGTHD